jgi:hypothetical protein
MTDEELQMKADEIMLALAEAMKAVRAEPNAALLALLELAIGTAQHLGGRDYVANVLADMGHHADALANAMADDSEQLH